VHTAWSRCTSAASKAVDSQRPARRTNHPTMAASAAAFSAVVGTRVTERRAGLRRRLPATAASRRRAVTSGVTRAAARSDYPAFLPNEVTELTAGHLPVLLFFALYTLSCAFALLTLRVRRAEQARRRDVSLFCARNKTMGLCSDRSLEDHWWRPRSTNQTTRVLRLPGICSHRTPDVRFNFRRLPGI
jgi:hypothetical protein